jgi:hypothetical protein
VQYDTDVTTWSPQGRIFQIEYAMEAVKQGSAAVGLKVRRGIGGSGLRQGKPARRQCCLATRQPPCPDRAALVPPLPPAPAEQRVCCAGHTEAGPQRAVLLPAQGAGHALKSRTLWISVTLLGAGVVA